MTRVGLLLSGVTPLSGVLHQLGGGVMLANWCNAPKKVQRLSHGLHETDVECANGEQLPAVVLVAGSAAPDP